MNVNQGIKSYTTKSKVMIYSPVEKSRDLIFEVKPDPEFTQIINLKKLKKGRYQIKIDWQANNVSYYQEEEFTAGQ